jgi:hypothetical protein
VASRLSLLSSPSNKRSLQPVFLAYSSSSSSSSPSTCSISQRFQSSALPVEEEDYTAAGSAAADFHHSYEARSEVQRLRHLRNVGVLAHVDAGKTTVTERMLALAGVVRCCGSVDDGNTVTDYLPAERERGITIQSAAISFEWGWHNNKKGDDWKQNDNVNIQVCIQCNSLHAG